MSRLTSSLWGWVRPHAGWLALSALLGAATVGSGIGLMATSAYLLSAAALQPSIAELGLAIVGVRFFGLSRGVFRYLERLATHTANLRLLGELRVWLYRTVEPLAPARLIDVHSGDLMARAVGDIDSLQEFFARLLAPPAVAVVVAGGTALFLGLHHGWLALLFLAYFAAAGLVLPGLMRSAALKPAGALAQQRAELSSQMVETLQGLSDLTSLGAQAGFLAELAEADGALAAAQRRTAWLQAVPAAVSSGLGHLAAFSTLACAVVLTESGAVDGVMLGALTLAVLAAFEAALPLPLAAQTSATVLSAAGRVFAMADIQPAVVEPERPSPLPDPAQGLALCVRNLCFGYPGRQALALQGIDLELDPGRRLAIVGPSGAGKSTLAALLLRLWEYDQGEVRLGGIDLRQVDGQTVRQMISGLLARPILFNTTLRENLLLANPRASDPELIRALTAMQLGPFLAGLPEGLETRVGEAGLALSAGERQRVALARTLLQPGPILLLDEPTAHLDALTAQAVLRSLIGAAPPRSLVLITHRLVGLEAMDEILVLSGGRVVERGTHARLRTAGGLYQRMLGLQNRTWEFLSEA